MKIRQRQEKDFDNGEKILYLECESGISGDMTVAALLDLGADQEALERALQSLPVDGFHAVVSRVKKAGLDMCDFDVVLDQAHENHDHDMEYLHGHENVHPEEHFHVHGEGPHTHGELIQERVPIHTGSSYERGTSCARRTRS